jgi:chorismate dehydratase
LKKIKVGIVNYLNTKPLLYGIERSPIMNEIELVGDYPANIATSLLDGSIDMGLVPVAVIPKMREFYLNTQYCIGCNGAVASVCLFSDVPIHEVKSVLLDYQSRTSTALAKILIRDYWKIDPELISASPDYLQQIKGTTAGLVIGDRSLRQRKVSKYIYDLGEAWKDHTGMPFVFAAWISNKKLDENFIERFNKANAVGLHHIDEIVKNTAYDVFDLKSYYTKHISYELTEDKRAGMNRFLDLIQANVQV